MRLRPRQKTFVERSVAALASRGNTLGVAPTGAGKTIMLSAVTGEMIGDGAKACVLAHRDELTAQNRAKFQRVVPGVATSVWWASWAFRSVAGAARCGGPCKCARRPRRT
jgi:superfamily II DNA or RNA helicase